MAQKYGELHVVFVPFFKPSHMIPIITTHYNALLFESSINDSGHRIFAYLKESKTSMQSLPKKCLWWVAITLLQKPIEDLIVELRPHCIVLDVCLPWTVDVTKQLKIPRLTFYPHNLLYHCVEHCLKLYTPHEKVSSDSESFLILGLPDKIEMKRIKELEPQSYAMIHDTIYDLEPRYAELYQKIEGKKPWLIGLLFQFSKREEASNSRDAVVQDRHNCLSWLDSQKPHSVVRICFGSLGRFSDAQLTKITLALEASDLSFLWVEKRKNAYQQQRSDCQRLMILNHPTTGEFMTHCGWNSTLKSFTAGVPMLTWPLFAEQFYKEKLVEILGCGVGVGAEVWHILFDVKDTIVKKENMEASLKILMNMSRESEKIRNIAKDIEAMIKRAVEKGGSSHNHLTALIEELKRHVFGISEE
ncbi:unnamed protein product [Withania somnifera]